MLRASFLLCLFPAFVVSTPCISCASPGLMFNWQLTGYPVQPSSIIYDEYCFNASSTALAYTVPCPTNICVETFIPTGVATWEVLRGCHANMIGSNSNFGSTVTGVTTTTRKCTQMKIDGRGDNALNFCMNTDDDPDTPCNIELKFNAQGLPTVKVINGNPCEDAQPIDCVICNSFDGKGKCDSGEKGRSKGYACGKTTGKLNGRDYVERGPTNILPSTTKDFCTPVSNNQTFYFSPFYGTNVTRSKRALNQVFAGNTCYCSTAECNSAPTVLATSMTLLVVLALVPFFC